MRIILVYECNANIVAVWRKRCFLSSELMTALYAAFAQAESESLSGNMRWSYQKRVERGEFNTYSAPLGYDLVNGKLVINKEAAPAIYFIFHSYIAGTNPSELVRIEYKSVPFPEYSVKERNPSCIFSLDG